MKIVPHHFRLVSIFLIYEAPCEAVNNKSDIRQDTTKDLALLVTLNKIIYETT